MVSFRFPRHLHRLFAVPVAPAGALLVVVVATLIIQKALALTSWIIIPTAVVMASGYLVIKRIPPGDNQEVTNWIPLSAIGAALILLSLVLVLEPLQRRVLVIALVATVFGVFVGLLVSISEINRLEQPVDSTATRVVNDTDEPRREQLETLTRLLRHETLNNMQVIQGRAEALAEQVDGKNEALDAIDRTADEMIDLLDNVRTLLEMQESAEKSLRPKNLSNLFDREISDLKASHPEIIIDADVPDDAVVQADDLLPVLFSNLLRNAVIHNTSPSPEVSIITTIEADTVTVRITDNGPGLPLTRRDHPFEVTEFDEHGLGLHIVKTLTERYGGEVAVESTGDEGTTFTVRLQRWTSEPISDLSR